MKQNPSQPPPATAKENGSKEAGRESIEMPQLVFVYTVRVRIKCACLDVVMLRMPCTCVRVYAVRVRITHLCFDCVIVYALFMCVCILLEPESSVCVLSML